MPCISTQPMPLATPSVTTPRPSTGCSVSGTPPGRPNRAASDRRTALGSRPAANAPAALTPPLASSIFYLKSVAPADIRYGHMYRAVVPFILIQLLLFLLVLVLPGLATWLPGQLF
ncbi:TRAP transporter large permease subunit [Pseudomonas leptonychotis]|uniref:TRAP transporter large permease subunit n=1 Tax=Pseudomonas leptonychotis TaxID=2448482 RepID=A0A4V6U4J6_9PSED|nr:TRAP transporter large permease subunit [Pseudomonas leptonychotis]